MSYSFKVTADTKNGAVEKIKTELEQVVAEQPSHRVDKQATQKVAKAFVDLLRKPGDGECVSIEMNGSLGWEGSEEDEKFTGASLTVDACITSKT